MNQVARDTALPADPSVSAHATHAPASVWALTLGSVGVVYGDIGTSPLYAFREAAVAASESGPITRDIVLGVLSMILWALIVVVTIKYVLILLRADNNGEGGTLSLTALAFRAIGRRTPVVLLLGIIGASMFLGDSVITPAISVLSAVEGLKLATPAFGHFGRRPIKLAWFGLVLPALLLNYFGQGAMVLRDPSAIANPFYKMLPEVFLLPMIVLATAATVIASQAVITGAYSLTYRAIQLGLLPRLAILHTSEAHFGQIYIPRVNTALLAGVLLLVLMFRTSSQLASAYGIAVTTTMVVDGVLGFIVIWKLWKWKWWSAALLVVPLVVVDATFLSANLLKLFEGAWAPLLFGSAMVMLIITWQRGSRILVQKTRRVEVPIEALIRSLEKKPPHKVPGTAVFLTSDPDFAPASLLHNLKHNKVLHEHNIVLTIVTTNTPRTNDDERVEITPISERFTRVALHFGFMEEPNVPKALALARKQGLHFDIMPTSFFLSRRSLKASAHSGMPAWQDRLFIGLARSANDATDFFHFPTGRVVEVGTQVAVLSSA